MKSVEPIRDKEIIEKMKNVLKRNSYRDYFLLLMGVNTGYRISDLLSFRVKDVRFKTHVTVREGKTKKNRKLKLHSALQPEIEEYIEIMGLSDEDYLFPSRKGGAISRVQAYRILNKAAEEVGLVKRDKNGHISSGEIGTHTLRKTFGYHHYQANKDVAQLQQLLGHSAPSVTLRYIGIHQDMLDKSIDDMELI